MNKSIVAGFIAVWIVYGCAAGSASSGAGGASLISDAGPVHGDDAATVEFDAGDDATADARIQASDLCGTPRDAPTCTACGADGLGYVWMGHCYYQCVLQDHSCEAPAPLNEWCDPICLSPKYLVFQSCVPCAPMP